MGRFDILTQENTKEVQINQYKSDFDFEKYEIEDENLIEQITLKEEEISKAVRQIAKKTLELGKMLYETQKMLANYNNGTFTAWFGYMGLDKNFVYREINRWEMFQKYRNPQIAEASVRTLEFIKKHEELEEAEIVEILEDPKQAPEKIKALTEENKEPLNSDKKFNKESELAKIDEQIEKYEEKIIKLKEKKEKIMKEED